MHSNIEKTVQQLQSNPYTHCKVSISIGNNEGSSIWKQTLSIHSYEPFISALKVINYVLWFFKRNHFPQQLCCEVKNMLPLSPSIILPDYHQIPENHRTVILPLEVKWLMSKLHYSPCQCHPEYQISIPLHYTHPLPSENALVFTKRDIFILIASHCPL